MGTNLADGQQPLGDDDGTLRLVLDAWEVGLPLHTQLQRPKRGCVHGSVFEDNHAWNLEKASGN